MIKQLTLFCTFAIFMLAVGGAVTSVWAHANCGDTEGKGKHSPDHPHCGVVNEDSTDDGSLYLVWVDGVCKEWGGDNEEDVCLDRAYGVCSNNECKPVLVDGICVGWLKDTAHDVCVPRGEEESACENFVEDSSGGLSICLDSAFGVCADVDVCDWVDYDLGIPPYSGHDPVGKKEAVTVNFHHIDMDLSFFQGKFNGDSDGDTVSDGVECFTGAPRLGGQTVLSIEHDRVKGKDKDTALVAWYVFGGFGTDGITNFSYRLKLWSEEHAYFLSGWRPTAKNDRFSVEFDHWELSSQNDIACTGKGSLDTIMTISIEKTN